MGETFRYDTMQQLIKPECFSSFVSLEKYLVAIASKRPLMTVYASGSTSAQGVLQGMYPNVHGLYSDPSSSYVKTDPGGANMELNPFIITSFDNNNVLNVGKDAKKYKNVINNLIANLQPADIRVPMTD